MNLSELITLFVVLPVIVFALYFARCVLGKSKIK